MTEFRFVVEQFSLSTADEEASLVVDQDWDENVAPESQATLPPGNYRVLAGELFRIVPGSPAV
ncbi:MAG: hypothetical protein KF689_14450 [Gemmatimonadaceae bacterium]|nr:hypothetical protein [Gemmatimonadaceae bacterium]